MKNLQINLATATAALILLSLSFLISSCEKDDVTSPSNINPRLSIVSDRQELYFGCKTKLTAEFNGISDDFTYSWSCEDGSFVGSGQEVTYIAPAKYGTYKCSVTVFDGKDSITSSINLNVTSVFFDDFSLGLDEWSKSYCNAWIDNGEAHVAGNSSQYWGEIYHTFDDEITSGYTISMNVKNMDNFASDEPHGLITTVTDPESGPYGVAVNSWQLQFLPGSDGINWRIICFLSTYFDADWVLLADDSKGYSSLIKSNDWNKVSWSIDADKKLTVKVNGKVLYESTEILEIENYFDIPITMDLEEIGIRTGYDEIAIDDVLVTSNEQSGIKANKEQLNRTSKNRLNNLDLPKTTSKKLRTIKEVLKSK